MDRRLDSLRALKRLLDEAFRVPGTNLRFGWDPLIGLIPWAGDALTALLGIGIILHAHQLGAPRIVQVRMLMNTAIDLVAGAIPFVGDAFDFVWKSNAKNFDLLERHVAALQRAGADGRPIASATAGDWVFVLGVITVIVAVAMIPLFVVYWLVHALGAHLSSIAR